MRGRSRDEARSFQARTLSPTSPETAAARANSARRRKAGTFARARPAMVRTAARRSALPQRVSAKCVAAMRGPPSDSGIGYEKTRGGCVPRGCHELFDDATMPVFCPTGQPLFRFPRNKASNSSGKTIPPRRQNEKARKRIVPRGLNHTLFDGGILPVFCPTCETASHWLQDRRQERGETRRKIRTFAGSACAGASTPRTGCTFLVSGSKASASCIHWGQPVNCGFCSAGSVVVEPATVANVLSDMAISPLAMRPVVRPARDRISQSG